MGYIYDTQIIYGNTKSNKDDFRLNGYHYYKTKTGIPKKQLEGNKAVKITNEEYNTVWNKNNEIFYL
jgi:hypothetical protein